MKRPKKSNNKKRRTAILEALLLVLPGRNEGWRAAAAVHWGTKPPILRNKMRRGFNIRLG
jgi:hypothetical protein